MHSIRITADQREQMVEITSEVEAFVDGSGHKEGVCILFVQHTTCGLTVSENADPDVKSDTISFLHKSVPQFGQNFKHFEPNSDAHIKSVLVGQSVVVPFSDGELLLGRWQGVFLCEFDGPRERTILMHIA
ncbi:MAG TPA: secondary thiamine-phosphate synthase enzyme YjbQ [Pyrinomonadaceae bacterium]|jgi:secondary thiamine-phosphate synthase enzyme|nr:secondary thiamine-phosphate synthase enzyme YjbQ [Pyrinomonadaceae bacterium]